jgi:hypothetical protein
LGRDVGSGGGMTATAIRCLECGLMFGVFGDELSAADAYLAHKQKHRDWRATLDSYFRIVGWDVAVGDDVAIDCRHPSLGNLPGGAA